MTRKVVLATISLHKMAGGLERNIVRISNDLASRGYAVSILSFDLADAESFYPIDPRIAWHKVGRTPPHRAIGFFERLDLLKRIRGVLPKGAAVIVFHHGLLARLMLAGVGHGGRIICTERNALKIYDYIKASKWNLNFFLMFFVSKIVVQFENYRKDYPFPMRPKIVVIPNVVEPAVARARPGVPDAYGRFTLLAVGRLCDQKNYPALIGAFAKLAPRFPDWDLAIVGGGALEPELKKLIAERGLAARVILPGASERIGDWYVKSHLYVMPSRWEGFPNALAEALAHGLPSVGFTGCAGVADLIRHGDNGLLAKGNGDARTLVAQLEKLMADAALRETLGDAAVKSVESYRAEKIYPMWEALL